MTCLSNLIEFYDKHILFSTANEKTFYNCSSPKNKSSVIIVPNQFRFFLFTKK